MPFAGLGLHFILAIVCAVHVVRSGQQLYWLFILFGFPVLGPIVYFLGVYLPHSRLQRGARRAVSAAVRVLDPQREVREARLALEETPTAQNRMRLASALLEAGDAPGAAAEYQACLQGPFASDPEIRYGAARAFLECQRHEEALRHLEPLRRERPDFRPEGVSLATARALAGCARAAEARREFEAAVARFGTYEAKAEYAVWAYGIGDGETAARLQQELDRIAARWSGLTRELNEATQHRLRGARDLAARQGA